MGKLIDQLKENLKLIENFKDNDRFYLTLNKYKILDENVSSTLIGKKVRPENYNWFDYKDSFIKYQKTIGFIWERSVGQGGPLKLRGITLSKEIGEEIAENLLDSNLNEGDFDAEIKNHIGDLAFFNVDSIGAKNGFGSKRKSNKRYAFVTNSRRFYLAKDPFVFDQTEFELGGKIEKYLRSEMGLSYILHLQEKRKKGEYQNVDFAGITINNLISNQVVDVYAMELKKSNRISDIQNAISQASNYRMYATHSFIIIPSFGREALSDSEQYSFLIKSCQENNIGIISILCNHEKEPNRVEIVLSPKRQELENPSLFQELLDEFNLENCPLCKKIVNAKSREECGWQVNITPENDLKNETIKCMKTLLEETLRKAINK